MAWRVAKSLLALRAQIDALSPDRNRRSDGTIGDASHAASTSDHNPWVKDGDYGVVTALDITHDPANGVDCGEIAEAIVASRDPRVKYLIFNRRIVSSTLAPWTWRSYNGSNPHSTHMHISVVPEKTLYDSERPWQIGKEENVDWFPKWFAWYIGGRDQAKRPSDAPAKIPVWAWAAVGVVEFDRKARPGNEEAAALRMKIEAAKKALA